MNQEIKSVLKKTAKIAGVTCVTAGAIAVMTSGVALKAIGEGGKYLAAAIKGILEEQPREAQEETAAAPDGDAAAAEEVPAAEERPAPEEG